MSASPAALSLPGILADICSARSIAFASYWPWSTRMGVVVELPSTSMVVVQLNFTGKPSGSEYFIVTAPVSSLCESVNVTAACSFELSPYFCRPPFMFPPIPLWESAK